VACRVYRVVFAIAVDSGRHRNSAAMKWQSSTGPALAALASARQQPAAETVSQPHLLVQIRLRDSLIINFFVYCFLFSGDAFIESLQRQTSRPAMRELRPRTSALYAAASCVIL
jgi:hypothetical protein